MTPEITAQRIAGDTWTFVAIEAQTKLVLSWLVARRDTGSATEFLQDVADRISTRIQLTTDGHRMYLSAVEDAFGGAIDYAMLHKSIARPATARRATARRSALAAFRRT